jgi:hypothetical protein
MSPDDSVRVAIDVGIDVRVAERVKRVRRVDLELERVSAIVFDHDEHLVARGVPEKANVDSVIASPRQLAHAVFGSRPHLASSSEGFGVKEDRSPVGRSCEKKLIAPGSLDSRRARRNGQLCS